MWKVALQSSDALSSLAIMNLDTNSSAPWRIPTPGCARRSGGRVRGARRGQPAGLVPHGRAGDARAPAHGLRGRAHGALHGRRRRVQGQLLRRARARRSLAGAGWTVPTRPAHGAGSMGRANGVSVACRLLQAGSCWAHAGRTWQYVREGHADRWFVSSSWTCLLPALEERLRHVCCFCTNTY